MRFDFQAFLPAFFDGRPFGPADLEALEEDAGVDRAVVMPEATDRPDNAGLAERIRGRERLVGCACVNPVSGAGAPEEFERCVADLGFRGLRLCPIAHGYPIDSDVVRPTLERAAGWHVPVTTESCGENAWPVQIGRIAERFPDVNFIADIGFRPLAPPVSLGFDPPAEGRIADVARERPNVYLGLTAMAAVETYLIKRLLGAVGPEKLVFGSNAPSGLPRFAAGGIRRAGLGEKAERAILGETLGRLYGLEKQ